MNTMNNDAAAWEIADLVRSDLDRQSCPDAYMRIAVESVVKHLKGNHPEFPDSSATVKQSLTVAPEAGNPVSVTNTLTDRLIARSSNALSFDARERVVRLGDAQQAVVEASSLAARQPVGEAVAWAALNQNGQIAYFDGKPMIMPGQVGNAIHTSPLYAAPPAQPAQVDLGQFRALVEACNLLNDRIEEYSCADGLMQAAQMHEWDEFREALDAAEQHLAVVEDEESETCEAGQPECGPVTNHDSKGVPLCAVCWAGLVADSQSGDDHA